MNNGEKKPGPIEPSAALAPVSAGNLSGASYSGETVRSVMAERFVRDSTGGVAGHPVAGIIALILFMDLVGARDSLIWFGILVLATAVRIGIGFRLKEATDRPLESRKMALLGALLVGLAWGLGGLLFGLRLPSDTVGILLVIMAGLVAAATATLVADKSAFYGFSTILLGSV
ncbi:MAG: hypothetical protein KJN92_07320, partial [Gemmatimonadetes bacterium]|nr:hypothetical protein [Gemmatimonadota bacterium]